MSSRVHHSAVEQFHRVVRDQLEDVWRHQRSRVEQAGAWLAEVLKQAANIPGMEKTAIGRQYGSGS